MGNRLSVEGLKLTSIGAFGLLRKARPGIPAHLHTGIDIMRPFDNYKDEPVFPIMNGRVISMRDDGPFAQIIIEHESDEDITIWTVYEHVSGIIVFPGDIVAPNDTVARFMSIEELNEYGWQFNHLHFEILKKSPHPIKTNSNKPYYFFRTFNLECYTQEKLYEYYYNPLIFFKQYLK